MKVYLVVWRDLIEGYAEVLGIYREEPRANEEAEKLKKDGHPYNEYMVEAHEVVE